jgi:cobalt-zinc-cadmium efflux system membrane fusion protein
MKNSIFILSAIILITVQSGCGSKTDQASNTTEAVAVKVVQLNDAQMASAGITTDSLKKLQLARVIHLNGQVKVPPQHVYSMSVPLGGYITATSLVPGTRVRRGELVATLEDLQYIELQQQYVSLKSRMAMLQADYERQRSLNESKASSDHDYQLAKAEWESSLAEQRALKEKLALLHIDADKLNAANISRSISLYAPFDGFASKVNVNTGKYVTPSEVIFEFIHSEDCYLGLTVYEQDLRDLQAGMKLIALGNSNQDTVACEISFVHANLTDQRSGEAICQFTSAHQDLVPGMFMQADVELGKHRVDAMPVESVVHYEGKNFIFVRNDASTFEMIEVTTGTEENGQVEVALQTALNGRQVVYNGAYALLMTLVNQAE